MFRLPLAFLTLMLVGVTYSAASEDALTKIRRCSAETDSVKRLACYDAIADAQQREAVAAARTELVDKLASPGAWEVRVSTSRIDDSAEVFLTTEAKEPIRVRFSQHRPILTLRCRENTTSAIINFDGAFVADIQSYGKVTFRIDSHPAFERSLTESTNNQALGFWRGNTAIPFIKELFGGSDLLVRAVPFNESPVTFEFAIQGLEQAIEPLRRACNW